MDDFSLKVMKVPEQSDWECHLFGGSEGDGITYTPYKGNEPNWFHRLMMGLILDCWWVRKEKP